MLEKKILLTNEAETLAIAEKIAHALPEKLSIYLSGPLGAGKTTFVRALLRILGVHGTIKSPTYSLVESYQLKQKKIYHLDLYRLGHPEELDFIGLSDYFAEAAIILIEWPEKAERHLPMPDLLIKIEIKAHDRMMNFVAYNSLAEKLIQAL